MLIDESATVLLWIDFWTILVWTKLLFELTKLSPFNIMREMIWNPDDYLTQNGLDWIFKILVEILDLGIYTIWLLSHFVHFDLKIWLSQWWCHVLAQLSHQITFLIYHSKKSCHWLLKHFCSISSLFLKASVVLFFPIISQKPLAIIPFSWDFSFK